MIPKSCRLFGCDHAIEQILRAKSRFNVKRFRSRAFSGKVGTGFPQKMRPNKESRARSRFNLVGTRSGASRRSEMAGGEPMASRPFLFVGAPFPRPQGKVGSNSRRNPWVSACVTCNCPCENRAHTPLFVPPLGLSTRAGGLQHEG